MKKVLILLACMLLFVTSMAYAAPVATIIPDADAPGGYNVLQFTTTAAGEAIHHTVSDALPGTEYTASFEYRVADGDLLGFDIEVGGEVVHSAVIDGSDWDRYVFTFTTPGEPPTETGPGEEPVEPEYVEVILRFRAENVWSSPVYLDNLQLVPAPEYTRFNNYVYEKGCCPPDFCWVGDAPGSPQKVPGHPSCVHQDFYEHNVTMPPVGFDIAEFNADVSDRNFLTAPNGFRCIDGEWQFARAKFAPLYDDAGYCPYEDQCFHYNPDSYAAVDNCVDTGEFIVMAVEQPSSEGYSESMESFYCYEGNWTTRTKEIALQLLRMTSPGDTYTLFCDEFSRSLNYADGWDLMITDYFGDLVTYDLAGAVMNGDINEFCVLELNGKVIGGVSLNVPVDQPFGVLPGDDVGGAADPLFGGEAPEYKSFMQMLKGPERNDYCAAAIEIGAAAAPEDVTYYPCAATDVYYNPKLMTVLFAKPHTGPRPVDERQSVPYVAPGPEEPTSLIGRIIGFIKDIFARLIGSPDLTRSEPFGDFESLDFIANAGSFDKLYINSNPDGPSGMPRMIRAVRDTRAHIEWEDTDDDEVPDSVTDVSYKTFIAAQYENYQVPICKFFTQHLPREDEILGPQIALDAVEKDAIQCTPVAYPDNHWMYSVYVEDPVFENIPSYLADARVWVGYSDSFWNDITAKIRTQRPGTRRGVDPVDPEIGHFPVADPVVDVPVLFTVENPQRDIIAVTWDFGDGSNYSSSSVSDVVTHTYTSIGPYDVRVCWMNSDYQISCSMQTVGIGDGPSVAIVPQDQSAFDRQNGRVVVGFELRGGTPEYTLMVDWGDGTGVELVEDISDSSVLLEHSYDSMFGVDDDVYYATVVAWGQDSAPGDPLEFDNANIVAVRKDWMV